MRYVITRVLPLPAPARISTGPSTVSTASRCCGFNCERNDRETAPEHRDQNFANSILQEGFSGIFTAFFLAHFASFAVKRYYIRSTSRRPPLLLLSQGTESYRVAQLLLCGDAVLPLPSRCPAKQIDRPRLERDRRDLTFFLIRFEAHARRIQQGNPDHDPELRGVPVPANWRTWRVLQDQPLD